MRIKKLDAFIDQLVNEAGFDCPEEMIEEWRKKRIVVTDDDGNVIKVLREGESPK